VQADGQKLQQTNDFVNLGGWLVGWLFNGTSTQKGQFVPTAGRESGSVG